MNQFKNFRFLCLLLIGGLIFSGLTGYPQKLLAKTEAVQEHDEEKAEEEEVVPAMASVSSATISEDDIRKQETVSDNAIAEEAADSKKGFDGTKNSDLNTDKSKDANVKGDRAAAAEGKSEGTIGFSSVEDDYFTDACFIGDSRVVSLYEYSDWKDAHYYCSSGMTLGGVFGEPSTRFKDGNWKVNIATALQHSHYGKIYIMLGINDMGVGDLDYFVNNYQKMIDQIREWQPDAVIYIQSIMNVSAIRSAQGDYINNNAINIRNAKLKEMDNGTDIIYLDINSVVCDGTGALNAEYTFDGVHLYARYVPLWTDYLKSHAIIR